MPPLKRNPECELSCTRWTGCAISSAEGSRGLQCVVRELLMIINVEDLSDARHLHALAHFYIFGEVQVHRVECVSVEVGTRDHAQIAANTGGAQSERIDVRASGVG